MIRQAENGSGLGVVQAPLPSFTRRRDALAWRILTRGTGPAYAVARAWLAWFIVFLALILVPVLQFPYPPLAFFGSYAILPAVVVVWGVGAVARSRRSGMLAELLLTPRSAREVLTSVFGRGVVTALLMVAPGMVMAPVALLVAEQRTRGLDDWPLYLALIAISGVIVLAHLAAGITLGFATYFLRRAGGRGAGAVVWAIVLSAVHGVAMLGAFGLTLIFLANATDFGILGCLGAWTAVEGLLCLLVLIGARRIWSRHRLEAEYLLSR